LVLTAACELVAAASTRMTPSRTAHIAILSGRVAARPRAPLRDREDRGVASARQAGGE
jgi:hypothetical protein